MYLDEDNIKTRRSLVGIEMMSFYLKKGRAESPIICIKGGWALEGVGDNKNTTSYQLVVINKSFGTHKQLGHR